MKKSLLAFGLLLSISGCGYRIAEGDKHKGDPLFPSLGGDSGFVMLRQVLAGKECLQLRPLDDGTVEAISLTRGGWPDTTAMVFIQRLDPKGGELSRTSRISTEINANMKGCLRCSDGSQFLGDEGNAVILSIGLSDSLGSLMPVKRFEISSEWMERSFGMGLEALEDSASRVGEELDRIASNHLLSPKRDSVLAWLDTLVHHRAYREAGIKSFYRLESGYWVQELGFDSLQKPVYLGDLGRGDPTVRHAARCSSLVNHPDPNSPLRAWDSSVIENSSSGNHFVFGFHPERMTYHRLRIGNRECRFKLYGYRDLGPDHIRMAIVGGVAHRDGFWIAAGRPFREASDKQRDTLYRIQLREGLPGGTDGASGVGVAGWLGGMVRKILRIFRS